MTRLEDWAVKGVRRMACAAAVAQGLSRHDAKATVEKKTRGPGRQGWLGCGALAWREWRGESCDSTALERMARAAPWEGRCAWMRRR
jgi:hypothetical protein